jgi:uncharacterized protein
VRRSRAGAPGLAAVSARVCVVLLQTCALSGCGPTDIPDKRQYLLDTWGESLLRSNYIDFRDATRELTRVSEDFVEQPSPSQLGVLREQWAQARRPWKRAEIFSFGPNTEHPQRFASQVNFWPSRPADVEAGVTSGKGSNSAALGASESGLPALDYLLFSADAETALLESIERRQYVLRVTRELALDAQEVFTTWDPQQGGYYTQLTEAGRASDLYASLTDALQEMIRHAAFLLDAIELKKLQTPLGVDVPEPEQVESRFSGAGLEDIRDNLACIEVFYFGTKRWQGLEWYLAARGKQHLSEPVKAGLSDARSALAALDGDLAEAVVTQPEAVRRAALRIRDLKRVFEVDVLGALALSVGYTPNDGD